MTSAGDVFARAGELLKAGHREEAKALIGDVLPIVPLDGFSDIGTHLWARVWTACLDAERGIVWATGDIGVALAITLAYPYDLCGRCLVPKDIVDEPSGAWWGYRDQLPMGLPIDDPEECGGKLVDAPGDGTLVIEDRRSRRVVIDYNGSIVYSS